MTAILLATALSLAPAPIQPACNELTEAINHWRAANVSYGGHTIDEAQPLIRLVAARQYACWPPEPAPPLPPPPPKPKTTPKPRAQWTGPPGVEQWRTLVASYFRAEDVATALCLMGYESDGIPTAQHPRSGAAGLFQIMAFWPPSLGYATDDRFIPEANVAMAAQIRDIQGWRAWSPYGRGLCRGL